jgi:hypothetical protein
VKQKEQDMNKSIEVVQDPTLDMCNQDENPTAETNKQTKPFYGRFLKKFNLKKYAPSIVMAALMLTLGSVSAMAQTGGTTIFGKDPTMIPNALRYAVIFLFGIAFLFGAGAVTFGVMQYTRRQEATNWIVGGALCMVVGGVVSGAAYIAGGNQLQVNQDISMLVSSFGLA